jgi:hypothetical protein
MAQDDRIDLRLPEQEPDSRSKYDLSKRDLSNTTTSEWLLFYAPGYRGVAWASGDLGSAQVDAALVPSDRDLPEVSVGIQGGNSSVTGKVSVGNELLRYTKIAEKRPKESVRTTNVVEANMGPAHLYRKWDSGSSEMGAHGTIPVGRGSLTPYWKRQQFGSDVARTSFGAGAQYPVGPGTLSGGVGRAPDVTSYRLGYAGKVGQGNLGLQGSLANISGVGPQMEASGTYNLPNIFGGNLSASAYLQRPASPVVGGGFRWTKRF